MPAGPFPNSSLPVWVWEQCGQRFERGLQMHDLAPHFVMAVLYQDRFKF